MRSIVVGYDGSDGARAALDEAIALARALGDRLVLVLSLESSRLGAEVADLDTAVRARARAVLAEGLTRARAAGVEAEVHECEEAPADGLASIAAGLDARMVVTGSHGDRPLKGMLLGSTPYRLLHRCTRPVLVVRAFR